jgi:hypothetical protein
MAESDNALAPKFKGVNRLIDFVMQRVPANMFPQAGARLLKLLKVNVTQLQKQIFRPLNWMYCVN